MIQQKKLQMSTCPRKSSFFTGSDNGQPSLGVIDVILFSLSVLSCRVISNWHDLFGSGSSSFISFVVSQA